MLFKHEKRKNDTELSEHLWALRAKNKAFTITWRILAKAKPYSNTTKRCGLCTAEKHLIKMKPHLATLNRRNKLVSTCRYRRKNILRNVECEGITQQDVVGLYPHIPHNEGLEALKEALSTLEGQVESEQQGSLNEDILSFAELVLKRVTTLNSMVNIIFKNGEQR